MTGFLLNENLPKSLVSVFAPLGLRALHNADLGLLGAPDDRVWEEALAQGLALVTKDSDFLDLALATGRGRVLHVAVGNCSTKTLRSLVESRLPEIGAWAASEAPLFVLS